MATGDDIRPDRGTIRIYDGTAWQTAEFFAEWNFEESMEMKENRLRITPNSTGKITKTPGAISATMSLSGDLLQGASASRAAILGAGKNSRLIDVEVENGMFVRGNVFFTKKGIAVNANDGGTIDIEAEFTGDYLWDDVADRPNNLTPAFT